MKLLLVVLTFATSLLSIQCRPQTVHFFPYHAAELPAPYPFASPVLTADGRAYSLVPYPVPYQAGLYPASPGPERGENVSPPASSEDRSAEKLKQQPALVVMPKPASINGSREGTKRLRVKKPKRVMNAPFLQALQQPGGQFKLQSYELVASEKLAQRQEAAEKLQELQRHEMQQQQQTVQSNPRPKSMPTRASKLTLANPVVVSSIGSTTADAPVPRVPVAPTVSEYYPFYGSPMTDRREEASLILEPSSKAISGNGGTAISTPVSHAILKQGSSTKILFRPQSVAIVGANGRAHAQADLIVDYVK